ncbi:MAG: hypothetical protein NTW96_15465 [Planctomycetia bacterium]|nr:hypothetical protein [Planctomycetia bacterium]
MNDANPATDAADLVEQLGHPQTRRAARQKLVAARAVGPLLECLDSRNESVVWAAVQSLGELRAKEAVEPLVGLLDRGTLVFDVCEALLQITGSNFGTDVKRWRESLKSAADPAKLDVAECVARTADYLGVKPTGSGTSYQFQLPLPEGRSQKVAVYFGRQDAEGHELVVIYSECGPANPKYYETVLRKNLSIPVGAFAIRDIDGQANFVMVDTMMAASADPGALARKIEGMATRADSVEMSLTKEDRR